MTETELQDRITDTTARIGMIGLGYVGLPLAVRFTEAGFTVQGYDIDTDRVQQLQDGNSYVDDITDAELTAALADGFTPADQAKNISACDVYVIAVPTDIKQGEPQMDAVRAASQTVAEQSGEQETLVVVASTVYPGATEDIVKPVVADQRKQEAEPIRLAMVPERINPAGDYDATEIPLVVGANSKPSRESASTLFEAIVIETHPVSSTMTAELTKTLENTYRMVNIALVNEMAKLSEKMGANVWEAIEAADTKPFGFHAFEPGPGVGGHCIPIDSQFLSWQGQNYDEPLTLVEHAHQANESMPVHVVDQFRTLLRKQDVELNNAEILTLGVAYKPDVSDTRNSPALDVCRRLVDQGASITIADPHVAQVNVLGRNHKPIRTLSEAPVERVDATIVLVDHTQFDYTQLSGTPLVFDTQNAVSEAVEAAVVELGKNYEYSRDTGNRYTTNSEQ